MTTITLSKPRINEHDINNVELQQESARILALYPRLPPTKPCAKCGEDRIIGAFYISGAGKVSGYCRVHQNEYKRNWHRTKHPPVPRTAAKKTTHYCLVCDKHLALQEFYRRDVQLDRHFCTKHTPVKYCPKCKLDRAVGDFFHRGSGSDELTSYCRDHHQNATRAARFNPKAGYKIVVGDDA